MVLDGGSVEAHLAADLDALVALAGEGGEFAAVGIDMPIGLPDRGRRRADVLAKAAIGGRRSSVFLTPVRPALLERDHTSASALNLRLAGEGISIQAFGLKAKLLHVEGWVRRASVRAFEVHPEVSFAQLAGQPLQTRKSTWAGVIQRRALLATAGIPLEEDFGLAGANAGVDDVLDAAAAAWTARRYAQGEAHPLPDPPEVFSDGWPCAIWV